MKIVRLVFKHGCTPADIVHAIAGAWQRTRVGEDGCTSVPTDLPDPERSWLFKGIVPSDLLEAIDEPAREDGQSPEAVVRQALARYLNTA